ncbi:hypothetical protein EV1_044776 [Malus domestica]
MGSVVVATQQNTVTEGKSKVVAMTMSLAVEKKNRARRKTMPPGVPGMPKRSFIRTQSRFGPAHSMVDTSSIG